MKEMFLDFFSETLETELSIFTKIIPLVHRDFA